MIPIKSFMLHKKYLNLAHVSSSPYYNSVLYKSIYL